MLTIKDIEEEIASHKDYKDLSQPEWEAKIEFRDLTRRSQKDFDWLKATYLQKLDTIREQLKGDWSITIQPVKDGEVRTAEEIVAQFNKQLQYLVAKKERIFDKLAAILQEEYLRENLLVTRADLHDAADYYIDYDNGNDSSDGLSTGNAWKTITKYTTTTSRTPGDRAFLRAGITWDQGTEATDIIFDDDGDNDDHIELIGCDSVTNDPWSDADDTKPIIDFEDAAYQFLLSDDTYWKFTRLDVRQSADANGALRLANASGFMAVDCDFSDSGASNSELLYVGTSTIDFEGCTFTDGWSNSLVAESSIVELKNCTLDAGSVRGSLRAIYATTGSRIYLTDCSIAPTNAFSTEEMYLRYNSRAYLRNVTYTQSEDISLTPGSEYFSEDHDGTFEAQHTEYYNGVIERDTTTTHSGGADSSAKMSPNVACGPNFPLILGLHIIGFARYWATGDAEITVTVYARVGTAWDSPLAAADAYLRVSYLDSDSDCGRTFVNSTEQISNDPGDVNDGWTAFTVTITPERTGWVYMWFYLEKYEDASEHILVDIKPVIS